MNHNVHDHKYEIVDERKMFFEKLISKFLHIILCKFLF
jgi:hypothetical protein